jgi:hypothetical protein
MLAAQCGSIRQEYGHCCPQVEILAATLLVANETLLLLKAGCHAANDVVLTARLSPWHLQCPVVRGSCGVSSELL